MLFLSLDGEPVLNEERYADIADSEVKTGIRLSKFLKFRIVRYDLFLSYSKYELQNMYKLTDNENFP